MGGGINLKDDPLGRASGAEFTRAVRADAGLRQGAAGRGARDGGKSAG